MKNTTNYAIKKPEGTDIVDIDIINANMDVIDTQLKKQNQQMDDLSGKVQDIDVSWKGIKDKPTAFPPAQHNHDRSEINNFPSSLPASGGNADTLDGKHANEFAPNGYGLGTACSVITDVHNITCNGWYMGSGVLNAPDGNWWTFKAVVHNQNWVEVEATPFTDAEPEKRKLVKYKSNGTWGGWRDPFGVVVNGKQEVVNAINDKLGYASGLTANNVHGDYGWWIRNKIVTGISIEDIHKFIIRKNQINGGTQCPKQYYTTHEQDLKWGGDYSSFC
ncbi:MAG: hypothetical protein AB9856_21145 [Cellulosilyticaceae bacterium]